MKKLYRNIFVLLLSFFIWLIPAPVQAIPPTDFQTNQIVGSGLDGPSGFEIAPDGRIFILERTGAIKIVKDNNLLETPFATLPSVASGDRGLIGIAFDPEFGISNHFVYFYYTATDLKNRLVRFDASTDIGTQGPFLLYQTNSPSQELHVGGSIQFGPDGKLYFAVGDNGYPPNAQNLSNPHGKILRINKDGTIPWDNPFVGQANVLPEIWAYGFRNPWRFQFDKSTGKLYGGDVGDFTWEEINQIYKGQNYGWPMHEGLCISLCGSSVNPIYTYNHDGESAAVTGGPVYRSSMFPDDYQGNLFFGDYAKGFIKRIQLDELGNSIGVYDFDLNAGSVVDLKVAPDGSLYYITYYPGRLYQVSYSTGNHSPSASATADKVKGIEPLTVQFSSTGSTDPDGDTISYFWKFGDGTTSQLANPTKTYFSKGTFTVDLAISDGISTTNAVPIVIQVGQTPNVNIGEPTDGSNYKAGNTIHFTVSATDGAGFDIDDRDLKTEVIFHHHTHTHPFLGPIIGRQGDFTIPNTGEASADTWYEIKATATDTNGLSTSKSTFIYPLTSNLTFNSSPSGLKILIDGSPYATPYTVTGVENFQRELGAPTLQILDGRYYQFERWSDNGNNLHNIVTPQQDTTYTAHFIELPLYRAEYFNNTELSGDPVVIRDEPNIDYLWENSSPDPLIETDNFSARWQRVQYFAAGRYKFTTATDDGVRLYIDGNLIIDQWHDNNSDFSADIDLTAGHHEIKMEYFEISGLAHARLDYDLAADQPPTPETPFSGQYFNNQTLSGTPTLIRNDQILNFDWTESSPDPTINPDHFSARWSKSLDLLDGQYQFEVTADDGVRVILDGQTIIDAWIDQPPTNYKTTKTLFAGPHDVVIEYYENSGGAMAQFSYQKIDNLPPAPNQFIGEYFNNKTLTSPAFLSRHDSTIDFDWGLESPDPSIPNDNFSVRWSKTEEFVAGNYEFSATGDDGIRLYVDDQLILDQWIDQPPTTYRVNYPLTEGSHTIVMEYFETGGGAVAKLSYQKINDTPTGSEYKAEYFNNKGLLSPVVLTRSDPEINFNWGGGSPDPLINANNFSARWTKTLTLTEGNYQFRVTSDDGVRVLVDSEIVLDKWIDQPPTSYVIEKNLTEGDHTVVIEYFENGGGATMHFDYVKTTPPSTSGFTAEYFNNQSLIAPVALNRIDSQVNFDWETSSPDPMINPDNFSARWTKSESFEEGLYEFSVLADDGVRLKIDGETLIDQWIDQPPTVYKIQKQLTTGSHTIVIEYYEKGGGAVAKLSYAKVIPTSSTEYYQVDYFNNIELFGTPVLTQQVPEINFNWAAGSPDPTINRDEFSARIVKQKLMSAGTYTLNLQSDDGVRLWIDDQLLVDDWAGHPLTTYNPTFTISEGVHIIKIEYFEYFGDASLVFHEP